MPSVRRRIGVLLALLCVAFMFLASFHVLAAFGGTSTTRTAYGYDDVVHPASRTPVWSNVSLPVQAGDSRWAATVGAGPTATAASGLAAETGAGGLSSAYHYTGAQNVAPIEADGLHAGSYATTSGDLSPLQAQIDLALPPNRGLPGATLQIDLDGLRSPGYEIPNVGQVARSYNMPGGGTEMQFPYAVPPQFNKVLP